MRPRMRASRRLVEAAIRLKARPTEDSESILARNCRPSQVSVGRAPKPDQRQPKGIQRVAVWTTARCDAPSGRKPPLPMIRITQSAIAIGAISSISKRAARRSVHAQSATFRRDSPRLPFVAHRVLRLRRSSSCPKGATSPLSMQSCFGA